MTTTTEKMSDAEIAEMLTLIKDADSVELKLTVPETARRSAVAALEMDPLDAQIRQVYFFDTPDLRLNAHGLVPRARRIQGKLPDSVVKLRPVVPSQLPSKLRKAPDFVVEVDAMPGGYVCSGTLKAKHTSDRVREAAAGTRPIRKLFTKEQRAFFDDHAPDGIALDDLSVLGPINVLKLKFAPTGFSRPMVAELWNYPDGSRILELSVKSLPTEAFQVMAEARALLSSRGVELGGHQQTKTRTALEFFSRELQAAR
jgi:hypothetical protein